MIYVAKPIEPYGRDHLGSWDRKDRVVSWCYDCCLTFVQLSAHKCVPTVGPLDIDWKKP